MLMHTIRGALVICDGMVLSIPLAFGATTETRGELKGAAYCNSMKTIHVSSSVNIMA